MPQYLTAAVAFSCHWHPASRSVWSARSLLPLSPAPANLRPVRRIPSPERRFATGLALPQTHRVIQPAPPITTTAASFTFHIGHPPATWYPASRSVWSARSLLPLSPAPANLRPVRRIPSPERRFATGLALPQTHRVINPTPPITTTADSFTFHIGSDCLGTGSRTESILDIQAIHHILLPLGIRLREAS